MKISSPVFMDNEMIPSRYTCDGENINPPLQIENDLGVEVKSLVLIVDDPDAPLEDFAHWVVWNIDPETREIAENSVPEGAVEGINSSGTPGYVGPCPPTGVHRYQFKLYALDRVLDLPEDSTKEDVEATINGSLLELAMCVGLYGREK